MKRVRAVCVLDLQLPMMLIAVADVKHSSSISSREHEKMASVNSLTPAIVAVLSSVLTPFNLTII